MEVRGKHSKHWIDKYAPGEGYDGNTAAEIAQIENKARSTVYEAAKARGVSLKKERPAGLAAFRKKLRDQGLTWVLIGKRTGGVTGEAARMSVKRAVGIDCGETCYYCETVARQECPTCSSPICDDHCLPTGECSEGSKHDDRPTHLPGKLNDEQIEQYEIDVEQDLRDSRSF